MNIALHPPPREMADQVSWQQWTENLWRFVSNSVQTSGDANATISSGTTLHGVTSLTAPRTLTLPEAAKLSDGDMLVVQDESGSAGTHAITIQRQGTDTINGGTSITITTNFGRRTFIKRGSGKFYAA